MQNENAFNSTAHVLFGLPKPSNVKIDMFNILGERLAILLDAHKPASYHVFDFNASNLASGIYVYRIQAGGFSDVKKMILMK